MPIVGHGNPGDRAADTRYYYIRNEGKHSREEPEVKTWLRRMQG